MVKKIILFLAIVFSQIIQAQVKGIVTDSDNNPIQDVVIHIKLTNKWTITDEKGAFNIATNFPITLAFSYLGRQDKNIIVSEPTDNLNVVLPKNDLKLDEVIVTAEKKKESLGSTIKLGKQAINLVQAQSLANIMQLVPGTPMSESSLNQRQLLSIRSAYFDSGSKYNSDGNSLSKNNNEFLANNTFGVGYLVDDVPLSNDINMTGTRGTQYSLFSNINKNGSVNLGVDLKTLSTAGIESVEVVQGISSAKYGDHTSGLVKINYANGSTPFNVRTVIRGGSLNLSLSKGFRLPKKLGFLNINVAHLHSNSDPRKSIAKFDRITTNGRWSYKKDGKISNVLSFSFNTNFNSYNTENSGSTKRKRENDNKGFRLSNTNTINFNERFIGKLSSSISVSYGRSLTSTSVFASNGGKPILGQYQEGTYEITYTPVSYWATEAVENKPFRFFARTGVNKVINFNKTNINIDFGGSINLSKNFGRGNVSSSNEPLVYNSAKNFGRVGFRNINFNSLVPTDVRYSAYLTSNIKTQMFDKKWLTTLGVRYDNYNKQFTINPRLNTSLQLSKVVKLSFGFGLFSKAPSLQSLYPGDIYYDYLLADIRTNSYAFGLGHTFVRKYKNEKLKPSQTIKYETGVDIDTRNIDINLTGYYSRKYNGFTSVSNYETTLLPNYKFTYYPNRVPDYTLNGYKRKLLSYSTPTNSLESVNKGIELSLFTKKIKSINTSFSFSGVYRYTKNDRKLPAIVFNKTNPTSDIFLGYYKSKPNIYETLRSSVSLIHHISKIGLVITLRAEQFIMSKNSYYAKVAYPYAYRDRNLVYYEIPKKNRQDKKYSIIRRSLGSSGSSDIPNAFTNYHINLSKQFDNGFRFSFYAINFLNHLPKFELLNSDGSISNKTANSPISFGGSIFYKF